jgi:hypothetical protein
MIDCTRKITGKSMDWIYRAFLKDLEAHQDIFGARVAFSEISWINDRRPYYKVWPAILDSLRKIKLDIPCNCLQLKSRIFLVRFPLHLQRDSILVNACRSQDMAGCKPNHSSIADILVVNSDPESSGPDTEGTRTCGVDLTSNSTFRDYINNPGDNDKMLGDGENCLGDDLRIALTILLLADDPTIIEPEVLSRDEARYRLSKNESLVEKAHRRGKIGWHIGRSFEMLPHFRRPHLALRHTGRGRTIPRIVPVKGCIVHRQKVTKVPTGHLTPEGLEVETAQ